MSSSKILWLFGLTFIGGVAWGSFFYFSSLLGIGILILSGGLFLSFLFLGESKFLVLGICLVGLILGGWRVQGAQLNMENNPLAKFNQLNQEVILEGTIVEESQIKKDSQRLVLEPLGKEGRILVFTSLYPSFKYGDRVKIRGKLEAPPVFDDFNYPGYLAKDKIYSVMYQPQIETSLSHSGQTLTSVFHGKILEFKNKLRESIYSNLSPPGSFILGSMILGDKQRIPEDLKQKLNISGVRHITAISGMHITILSIVLVQLLIGMGLNRGLAFYLSLGFLGLFIVMVGLPPSAVRAGIMGGMFLLAQRLGRAGSASRSLPLVAGGMLAANPLLLKYSVGFQLSFLAVAGIIYLSPHFSRLFRKIPQFGFFNLRSILAMTFSAQILTLPLLIYNFGTVSLIAPLTNILVLPLIPFIIGGGFLFGLVGMVSRSIGQILSWPIWVILSYVTKVIDWFSRLPISHFTIDKLSVIWVIIPYLVMIFLWIYWNKNRRPEFLEY